MQIQFAAEAYQTRSEQLLAQRCVNAFVEPTPKQGKTQYPVYGIPGLSTFARFIAGLSGAVLGLHIMGNDLFVVCGGGLYKVAGTDVDIAPAGSQVPNSYIGATSIRSICSMADNGQQLVMVDGSVGWIYQPGGLNQVSTATAAAGATSIPANITGTITSGDTLTIPLDNGGTFTTTAASTVGPTDTAIALSAALPAQVTAGAIIIDAVNELAQIQAAAWRPASTVRYFDGYFCFDANGTRQFFISSINDGTQYSGLDFATASAGSDRILAVEVYHEQLMLMCERHIEVWWDTGNVSFPFQRYDAALIQRGISYPYAVTSEDNTILWMGDDGIFYRLEVFTPRQISTFAMEHAWAQYPRKFLDCSCFTLNQEGHKFVVVNFPSGPATWCYDIAASAKLEKPMWHERESWGTAWV